MTELSSILAVARNGTLGDNNQLPWHLPIDLKKFRALTLGKPVIMGRGTWESLPNGLPQRHCIVISHRPVAAGALGVTSPEAALEACAADKEAVVIGGVRVYQYFLPLCVRLYLTLVEADLDGDTKMPPLDLSDWNLVDEHRHEADDRHQYAFVHQEFVRAGTAAHS